MRTFLREKIVISESAKKKGMFELQYMRLEEQAVITKYTDDKVYTHVVDKWVHVGDPKFFSLWKDVQQYLIDTIYRDQVFIQNLTGNYINFKMIEVSDMGKFMR